MGIPLDFFWFNTWKENQLLGESYNIKQNLEWERIRYLATMIHNVNCQKKSQMKKPEDLLKLPQDNIVKEIKPKSNREDFEKFWARVERAGLNKKS